MCFNTWKLYSQTISKTLLQMILLVFFTCIPDYVDDILDLVFEKIIPDPGPFTQDVLQIPIPELL